MKISTVKEMREMDATAIKKYGIADQILMENAGQAVFFVILKEFGIKDKKFVVICGNGNNGGDGFVVARKILSNGGKVKVFVLAGLDIVKGTPKTNLDILFRLPVEVKQIETADPLKAELEDCDAVVDAIFGTGLDRNVKGLHRDTIEAVNNCGKTVFSVDIPSGVNGDTGKIMGTAIKANYTTTFGLPKIGNMLLPGFDLCGKIYVTHISFPPELYNSESLKLEISAPLNLPPRDKTGHKGTFGDVLFIAGASCYLGAPYFAAISFLKAGGGYSRLASPESLIHFIANKGSEIVLVPQKETDTGSISLTNKQLLLDLSQKTDMVVIGPGLSLQPETQQLVRELASEINKPMLIDGDGITALCSDLNIIRQRKAETILTPHLGEMSRITGMSVEQIDADKIRIVQQTARELNAIIVLKGAHSLIGYPDERVFVNMSGNSGMATAGSGDVLTGTIAAMACLGLSIQEAVKKGVFIHGLAGDLASVHKGEDGMTAQDILDFLPLAVKMDREGIDEPLQEIYAGVRVI